MTRTGPVALVVVLTILSSYCTNPESQTPNDDLSADEAYLVETYALIDRARDARSVNDLKSDSLFAVLDSTIDTLRIANTIRSLDEDPDRWILIFRAIEQKLSEMSQQGQESEEPR